METSLIDLLKDRAIVHPTRIADVDVGDYRLRLTIAGNPWWREGAGHEEEQIVLTFEGVWEGLLDPQTLFDMDEDEQLEVFCVSKLSDESWAENGTCYETYCSEPLPEPLNLYAAIEDYLWNNEAPRTARSYLNVPGDLLSRYCEVAAKTSFLLARAPQRIHEIVLAELKRQSVSHTVLTSEWPRDDRLFVRIGGSRFTCERATAEV